MRNPFQRIRDFFRNPPMIGRPPSERPMWHDPAAHARDFAERYAEPIWLHDRIDAVIAHEDAESLTGDNNFAGGIPDTSLAYRIDIDWLLEAYTRTRKDGAVGVDGQDGEDYAANLMGNLQSLLESSSNPARTRHRRYGESNPEGWLNDRNPAAGNSDLRG